MRASEHRTNQRFHADLAPSEVKPGRLYYKPVPVKQVWFTPRAHRLMMVLFVVAFCAIITSCSS